MEGNTTNKTIAKNTVILYFRMMFMMVVSLFTSRVVLQKLGVEDYGLYQTVGSVVLMLSFVNNALATGSSRFLTFELGTGDKEKLKRTFSTTLIAHFILALLIVILAETVGLWFVYNKLIIAPERLSSAVFVYHISLVTAVFTITQVPYNALIMSHEKMNIYAYTSIYQTVMQLLVVYMLAMSNMDKLKLYALLLFIVQCSVTLYCRYYCVKNFEEAKFRAIFDWQIMRQVSGYSGWNLFANTAIALVTQGTTILLNMFFNPSVVAGRAIANQVNAAAGRFVSSFRTAANPQIVKKYAAGDKEGSKELLIRSTVFSYYIMWVLILPLLFVSDTLLQLWLGQIPDYSIPFLQLTLVTSLFQVFDSSLYMALYAKGQIKENAMLSPTMGFISFGVMYLFFKLGFSPISLGWILLIDYAIIGVVIKPILAIKIVDYTMNDMVRIFLPCVKVTLMSLPIPLVIFCYRELIFANDILSFIGLTMVSVLSVCITVWYIGLDEALRNKLLNSAKFRIQKLKLKK